MKDGKVRRHMQAPKIASAAMNNMQSAQPPARLDGSYVHANVVACMCPCMQVRGSRTRTPTS